MANSAVLFGDGKELDASIVKETIDAIKQGRDIFAETIGLVKDIRDEVRNVARDLDKWLTGKNPIDPNSEVIIWQHKDYGNPSRGFRMDEIVTNYQDIHYNLPLISEQWNDEASSVKVSGAAVFVAWEHASFGGNRLVLLPGTSIPFLGHVAGGWNDQISSSKVIKVTDLDQIFT
jgi:hypothetical protein